jgi:hypothetical protein
MLSVVLRSETAVKVSIEIMPAFVAIRRFMLSGADMFKRKTLIAEAYKVFTNRQIREF